MNGQANALLLADGVHRRIGDLRLDIVRGKQPAPLPRWLDELYGPWRSKSNGTAARKPGNLRSRGHGLFAEILHGLLSAFC